MKGIITALKGIVTIGPHIKSWIYSDGKWNIKRSVILAVMLVILMLGYAFIPHEMHYVIESLDEISDIIGYAENSL